MLGKTKSNSIEREITEALMNIEIGHEDLWQLLMKKKTVKNQKEALGWWKNKEVILKKSEWIWVNLIEEG